VNGWAGSLKNASGADDAVGLLSSSSDRWRRIFDPVRELTARFHPTTLPGAASRCLTALELFAGAGGMAMGMHLAGYELVDLVESNEACCETLRRNADLFGWKDPGEIDAHDVKSINWTEYRDIDLLCAGAPCQPFSNGGRKDGRLDERNMLGEVVKAIAAAEPRAFVIENVRGLLFPQQINYFRSILARLRRPTIADPSARGSEDLYWLSAPGVGPADRYRVDFKIIDCADFGLAQRRPRLFIVGLRRDVAGRFEWPHGGYSRADLIEDLRGESYWKDHPDVSRAAKARARARLPQVILKREGKRWRTLRDVLIELGSPARRVDDADDLSHVVVPGARLYGKHTGSPIDWVSKTVKAGVHGSPGGEHIVVFSPGRFRYLTVRECATIQGFPQAFRPPAVRTPAMRQLGNAVPVTVAEVMGRALGAALRTE
jgi:DNA (cytosine-5)-methyltransferase 1